MKIKTGNVEEAKTMKAGCGMRYDPDQLGDQTGFDFPGTDLWELLRTKDKPENESEKTSND
ncbi:hypothetical protein ACFOEK_07905 [Litoribrevibacter euphylliae]|uniref:Uncharacterized protein n=1 Tax=Litoribrevibacter euphylliae TaxID=1834034 RepID=A0ABV7HAJ1_9GAMM